MRSDGEFAGTERFSVRRRLGKGGNGVVYEALDRERNAVVALKTLQSAEPGALYAFKKEFRSLADLSHRNLVALHELHAEGDVWFFTMELVHGRHFAEALQGKPVDEHGWLPRRTAKPELLGNDATLLRDRVGQLALGLQVLHRAGKIHRDIKHQNVLIDDDGRVVILDFGLVTDVDARNIAATIDRSGTPPYMSPEQLVGEPVTQASDWYSVGIMIYEVLTGRRLFRGDYQNAFREKTTASLPPVRTVAPRAPPNLAELCDALVDRIPQNRPAGDDVLRALAGGDAAAAPPPGRAASSTESELVGREGELAGLHRSFSRTYQGASVVTFVHGASGVGKSALVRRFLEEVRASDRSAVVLRGRCYERESVPYKTLDGVVDALSRFLNNLPLDEQKELMPTEVSALMRLFPVLGRVEAVATARRRVGAEPDAVEARRRGFQALRELFVRLAAQRPLVVVIDDLQWGDFDSAGLLDEILRPPGAPAFLLVGVFRSEERDTSPFLRRLLSADKTWLADVEQEELALAPLAGADAARLARLLLAEHGPVDEARAAEIAAEAGGLPFFIAELVRFAASGAVIAPRSDGAPVDAGARLDLRAAILARIEQLPDEARRLVEVVALASKPVDRRVAVAAARVTGDDEKALHALRAGHLLRARTEGERTLLESYHDRIREAVVEGLAPDARRDTHARLAAALEAAGAGDDPEALAHHLFGAGERDRGAAQALLAADDAAAKLAFDRAGRLYGLALDATAADDPARRGILERTGRALANAGQCAEAGKAFVEAAALAPPLEARELRREAAELFLLSGRMDEGLEIIRGLLAGVGMSMPRTQTGTRLSFVWNRARLWLHGLKWRERDEKDVDKDDLFRIDVCRSIATGLLSGGDALAVLDFSARSTLLSLKAGEPRRVGLALATEAGAVVSLSGAPAAQKADAIVAVARGLAERFPNPSLDANVSVSRGTLGFWAYRFRASLDDLDAGERMLRENCAGVWATISYVGFLRLGAYLALDEWKKLARRAADDVVEGVENGDAFLVESRRTYLSLASLMKDDVDGARAAFHGVRERWSRQGYQVMHWLSLYFAVLAELYAGDAAAAHARLHGEWDSVRRSLLLRVPIIRTYALQLRANVSLATAAADSAAPSSSTRAHLRAAQRDAHLLERAGTPWSAARAVLVRAQVASLQGDAASARALLEQAVASAHDADLAVHEAVALRHAGALAGGAEGKVDVDSADAFLKAQGVARPARIAAMLAPGFPSTTE